MSDSWLREVEQFLYREARMLDERRFHEWLDLFTDDIHYWMGNRRNLYPRISKAITILDPANYREDDLPRADELAILDETKQSLAGRITSFNDNNTEGTYLLISIENIVCRETLTNSAN